MKILTWLLIFVFGFVMWAGVGFKVLEWISGELIDEAWNNSYKQFQQAYPGSTAQKQANVLVLDKLEVQKHAFIQQTKDKLTDYIVNMIKGWTGVAVSPLK